jgi:hypothetical protein
MYVGRTDHDANRQAQPRSRGPGSRGHRGSYPHPTSGSQPESWGSGGSCPRETFAAHAEADQRSASRQSRSWARRDLNPHVLSDTRT